MANKLSCRLRKALKKYLLINEPHCCFWCGTALLQNDITTDHLIPTGIGGSGYDRKNIVVACYACNQIRSHKLSVYLNTGVRPSCPDCVFGTANKETQCKCKFRKKTNVS